MDIQFYDHDQNPWGCDILHWYISQVISGEHADQHGVQVGWKLIRYNQIPFTEENDAELKEQLMSGQACIITFEKPKVTPTTLAFCMSLNDFVFLWVEKQTNGN